MFNAGSIVVSRTMVHDKLSIAIPIEKFNVDEKNDHYEKLEVLHDFDIQGQSNPKYPLLERMPQLLGRSVRSLMLCSIYYQALFGFFCLMELVIHGGTITAVCVGFICAVMLAAPLHMLWTHTLISPQLPDVPWMITNMRNILSWRNLGSLYFASMAYASSQVVVIVGSVSAAMITEAVYETDGFGIGSLLVGSAVMAVAFVGVHLPATILLTRVESSLMKPVAERQDCQIPLLDVMRSTGFSIVWKTLKVYTIFIAGLVSSTVLLLFC